MASESLADYPVSINGRLSTPDMEPSQAECAVCLQKLHHPTRLPCNHVFCFLCVKGVAIQNKKCAMCRAEIPSDYLDNPDILEEEIVTETQVEYQWYYEGRNGWWKYDEVSNDELEAAFAAGETRCTLLLAGSLYCIDFEKMIQMRRNDNSRRRKVRRDTPTLPSKGIAGIKIFPETDDKAGTDDDSPSSPNEVPSEQSSTSADTSNERHNEGVVQLLESMSLNPAVEDSIEDT